MDVTLKINKPEELKSWRPMFRVLNNPIWRVNGMAFATEEEAFESAKSLAESAAFITDFTVIHSTELPNHRFLEGQNFQIEVDPTILWVLL